MSSFTILKPVPCVHFGQLLVAKAFKDKADAIPKYAANFLFDPDSEELKALKEAAVAVAKEKWPGRDIGADFKSEALMMPWALGDKIIAKRTAKLVKAGKADDGKADYQKGKVVLRASTTNPPRLCYYLPGGGVSQEFTRDDGAIYSQNKAKFYSGVLASAEVNLAPVEDAGGKDWIVAYLNLVASTGKGERIGGGGRPASEVFKGYAGKVSAENPTEGLDDEIPF